MQEAKKLVVDIVTWNSQVYLPNLFETLAHQDTDEFTVTVVDNASNDGTVKWLADMHPGVTVLRNFRNQGFARAHNQAIALALSRWPEETWPYRYVLVTNPDIEFSPECIRRLIRTMDTDPSIAACAPKLLRAVMKSQDDEGRMESERLNIIDACGLIVKKNRRMLDRGAGEEDKGQYDGLTDVFGFSGACVLIRASALVDAKLAGEFFDEDFFMYQEDTDLAWRMQRLGLRSVLVPSAVAWHHRRAPSLPGGGPLAAWMLRRKKSPLINYWSSRNHLWMMWKNDEWVNIFFHGIYIFPYETAKLIASIFSWSALRGNVSAYAGIFKMIRKRREVQKRARVSGAAMRKWFV